MVITGEKVCDYKGRFVITRVRLGITCARFVFAEERCVYILGRFVRTRERYVNTKEGL